MPQARFFYGVSAGFGVGWLLVNSLRDGVVGWLLVGAATALALGLGFHQHYRRESRGRRWRRTTSFGG
ncbi:MAG: hypothetical protein WAL25_02095 [Acidimicrobiia bacterium]